MNHLLPQGKEISQQSTKETDSLSKMFSERIEKKKMVKVMCKQFCFRLSVVIKAFSYPN